MPWFVRFLPSPSGAQIRERIGGRYYLLPTDDFECKWHRRHTTSDQIRKHAETTGTRFSFPCERAEAWGAPEVHAEDLKGLLIAMLPDGVQVAVIPAVERIGTVPAGEWARIKEAARSAKRPVLRHAYQTSLARFQRWQDVGPDALKTIHDRELAIQAGTWDRHPECSLAYEDMGLAGWIFVHARTLFCSNQDSQPAKDACMRRIVACTPHKLANATMVAATGYTAKAIAAAVYHTGKGHRPRKAIESPVRSKVGRRRRK